MFKIEELDRLAARLELAAAHSEAAAKTHAEAGEEDAAKQQQDRADSGRHYVAVLNYFAKVLRAREKSKAWTPPSFGEVLAFASSDTVTPEIKTWPHSDIRSWYDHFESNGWRVSGKTRMQNWHAAARNGFRSWKAKNAQRAAQTAPKNGDPDGWMQYLRERNKPYREFRYAMDFEKNEFSDWKSNR